MSASGQYRVCARKLLRRRADIHLRCPRLREAQFSIRIFGPWLLRRRADVDLRCPGPRGSATRYPGLRPMASEQARRYPRVCPIAFQIEEACRYPPLVPKARYWIEEDASRRGEMRLGA